MNYWYKDYDKDKNPIVNYYADRQLTEFVVKRIEMKVIKPCYYCKNCENYIKLPNYKKIFNKQGFWTFNKFVKT